MDGLQHDEQAKQKEAPNVETRSTGVRTTILDSEHDSEFSSFPRTADAVHEEVLRRGRIPFRPFQSARKSESTSVLQQRNLQLKKRDSLQKKAIPVRKFPSVAAGSSSVKKSKLSDADKDEKEYQEPCIGIDLGTSFSCVGVYHNGKVEIVANEHNNRITPSCLSFIIGGKFVGEVAKNLMATNPLSTIFDAKRLIGRRFSDSTLPNDQRYWPFQVLENIGDQVTVQFDFNGTCTKYAPDFVATMILEKMKETAEAYLGEEVTNAVITVPAHFTDLQRKAIHHAGIYAGLNVLRVMNETSAAAMAYGLENKSAEVKNLLIYDLGGGFLDVSVISFKGGTFEVKGTANDSHLGGEDFDIQLVDHLAKKFERKHGKDLSSNPRSMCRLRTACEGAKRTLSYLTQATIEILSLYEGIDFYATITRSCFEDLCVDLFHRTLEPVKKALHDAKMDKTEINEIVLVGGSTRIPRIQKLLQHFFNGKELNKSIHPDEAVACGATVQAAILSGYTLEAAKDFLLLEASSHSYGIEVANGIMSTFIERNNRIPAEQTKIFTTKNHNQSSVLIQVYEGEGAMTRENVRLGELMLSGIRSDEVDPPKIKITFCIDSNGRLTMNTACNKTKGHRNMSGVNRILEGKMLDAEKMKLVLYENNPRLPTQTLSQSSEAASSNGSTTSWNDIIFID